MAAGRFLRGIVALVGVAAATAAGATWLPALARVREDNLLLRASRETPPMATLSRGYAGVLPGLFYRSTSPRIRVGVQVGHWRQGDLPAEMSRLRSSGGAVSGAYREVDINYAIARELVTMLGRAGIAADLLSSTIPPGYLADAILAIHADGANRPTARGWKMAAPWRSSVASIHLLDSLSSVYGGLTGLPEDPYGVTIDMKGYYAFSPHRFQHAISPLTPAVIVETGFVTVASDREVIAHQPRRVARALAVGLVRYLAGRPLPYDQEGRAALLPRTYSPVRIADTTELRAAPDSGAPLIQLLEPGVMVTPMQVRGDWAEVRVSGGFRRFGWVRLFGDRVASGAP